MIILKIGLIGYGVVGKAADNTFREKFNVIKYDKYQDLDTFEDLKECDFIFIMVPTPFDCEKNKVDLSAVEESLAKLDKIRYKGIILIKSTIPPGTCDSFDNDYDLEIVFNPEFLRESTTPNEDFQNQDTIVIGTFSSKIFEKVKMMYSIIAVSNAKYYHTTALEAEMIKTAQNTMLASRVALANMIFDTCQKHNIDYEIIKKIAFDNFEILGSHMTEVPGPDGKRGFGGKCLPKDIRAFATISDTQLVKDIIEYNGSLRDDFDIFLMNYKK